jgi:hypothetical protein
MFRRLSLSIVPAALLSIGAFGFVPGVVNVADAHSYPAHQHARFEVRYRADCHQHWRCYGTYFSHREAGRVAQHLRCDGYEVFVERE